MKLSFSFSVLALCLSVTALEAQELATPPPMDPAKEAEYAQRYKQGTDLEASGDLKGAREVFEKIIAEVPTARGSLREAGILAMEQDDYVAANAHFEALHKLEPQYPAAYEYLIEVNEALGKDIKSERLVKEFHALHEAGVEGYPDFASSLLFVRERAHLNGHLVIFSEFFDYTKDPNTVWMAEELSTDKQLLRRVLLNYDPKGTADLREKIKDTKFANAEEFLLLEQVLDDKGLKAINVYKQYFSLPDYSKTKALMLEILTKTIKPVYISPVAPKK